MSLGPQQYPEGYSSAIIAFEFASDPTELHEVLGDLTTQERASLDKINYVDFGFMILYGMFLFLLMSRLSTLYPSGLLARLRYLMPIVVMADASENMQLLKLNALDGMASQAMNTALTWLAIFTWTKWLTLAICICGIGGAMSQRRQSRWLGYTLMIPLILGLSAFVMDSRKIEDVFGMSIFLSFFIVLVYSFLYRQLKE